MTHRWRHRGARIRRSLLDDLFERAANHDAPVGCHEISEPGEIEDRLLTALVRGILDLGGLRFDAHGRLL